MKVLAAHCAKAPPPFPNYTSANAGSIASILRPPIRNGLSHAELKSIWSCPPPPIFGPRKKPLHIACVFPQRFRKYAKTQPVSFIWYTSNDELEDERQILFEYVEEQLQKGYIRRSTSSTASPILFIRCKTRDLCLCIDYHGLNAITKKNRYPLPLTTDLLDRVQGCTTFTVLDLKNTFNLIRIKEGDEWKTAFRTHLGLFEYTVMPFGLTNAPATFQAFIQDVLCDVLDISAVVYLDDILIFSHENQDHTALVFQVLEHLRAANVFLNAKKCEFDCSQVEYLGFIVSSKSVQMDPKKLQTISKWPIPRTVKQIQQFLGFTNFYRRFIHRYGEICLPLTNLTTNECKKSFPGLNSNALATFKKLKLIFTTAPVLRHFDPTLPSTIITDAFDYALASVHLQPDTDGFLHLVAYYSHKFMSSEINYEIHDKELLAIVECFHDMRSWLVSSPHPITVISESLKPSLLHVHSPTQSSSSPLGYVPL
ncbi:putative DNA RNA polymerase [Lyophyllum shimeji]|uniref:DNA RNA polymerase n=1 Tax=Lyophyllum shimeji TaxID=47721 RepID=A0A9P3UNW3_LYOSH|nr:putative DNA RNA polymerase [Lyophyllum shimeji]